jgi:hypothetical protein
LQYEKLPRIRFECAFIRHEEGGCHDFPFCRLLEWQGLKASTEMEKKSNMGLGFKLLHRTEGQ